MNTHNSSSRGSGFLHSLTNNHPDESRIANQVSSPHSAGLAHQAVKPFKTGALHPSRRANRQPAYVIEASSYAKREANSRTDKLRRYPFLLSGRAHRYEQQIGAASLDRIGGRV
jgi:hypothetical protein